MADPLYIFALHLEAMSSSISVMDCNSGGTGPITFKSASGADS